MSPEMVERLSATQRLAHFVIAGSIMILFLTGLPITFGEQMRWFMNILGGPGITMLLHRIAAFALILMSIYYGTYYVLSVITRKSSVKAIFFWLSDIRDFFTDLAFSLKMTDKEPRYSKYNWIMKASLGWAVFEIFVFIVTGLILWFPWYFLEIWPRSYMGAVAIIHSGFAIMALLHFAAHSFGNHFYPGKFPLNRVIFTGKISEEEAKREFPLWHEEVKRGE
ncbi:MAG: cytochrome b/b6 domain-containing protein [Candidatus Hydrothermarchaeota archaeon]|nr:cytochrome b/b6 domain-containing protein [Candidatus Hydrothermarchaeota archaeon]